MLTTPTHQELIQTISDLPTEVLPELAHFIDYLRFKFDFHKNTEVEAKTTSGSAVLLAIAGIGESDDAQVSERDEEILANEVDPIHGWRLKRD